MAAKYDKVLVNEDIPYAEVRLNGETKQEVYGVVSLEEALKIAYDTGRDVVLISDRATPPVCKVIEYGKFKYEQIKEEKANRKKQSGPDKKEIQFSPNIAQNDIEVKKNSIRKLLSKGNIVKVSMRFRGREVSRMQDFIPFMEELYASLEDVASVTKPITAEGVFLSMTLANKTE